MAVYPLLWCPAPVPDLSRNRRLFSQWEAGMYLHKKIEFFTDELEFFHSGSLKRTRPKGAGANAVQS